MYHAVKYYNKKLEQLTKFLYIFFIYEGLVINYPVATNNCNINTGTLHHRKRSCKFFFSIVQNMVSSITQRFKDK